MSADDEVYPSLPTVRDVEQGMKKRWDRFSRKGKKNVGVLKSIKNIYTCSCESLDIDYIGFVQLKKWSFPGLNILLLATPIAWYAHFQHEWHYSVVFACECFLARFRSGK